MSVFPFYSPAGCSSHLKILNAVFKSAGPEFSFHSSHEFTRSFFGAEPFSNATLTYFMGWGRGRL